MTHINYNRYINNLIDLSTINELPNNCDFDFIADKYNQIDILERIMLIDNRAINYYASKNYLLGRVIKFIKQNRESINQHDTKVLLTNYYYYGLNIFPLLYYLLEKLDIFDINYIFKQNFTIQELYDSICSYDSNQNTDQSKVPIICKLLNKKNIVFNPFNKYNHIGYNQRTKLICTYTNHKIPADKFFSNFKVMPYGLKYCESIKHNKIIKYMGILWSPILRFITNFLKNTLKIMDYYVPIKKMLIITNIVK